MYLCWINFLFLQVVNDFREINIKIYLAFCKGKFIRYWYYRTCTMNLQLLLYWYIKLFIVLQSTRVTIMTPLASCCLLHIFSLVFKNLNNFFFFFLAAGIREMLEKTGFFSCLDRDNLFVSVHDAVLHTQHQITSSVSGPMLNYSWTVKLLLSANAKQKLILKEILKT